MTGRNKTREGDENVGLFEAKGKKHGRPLSLGSLLSCSIHLSRCGLNRRKRKAKLIRRIGRLPRTVRSYKENLANIKGHFYSDNTRPVLYTSRCKVDWRIEKEEYGKRDRTLYKV